MNRYKLLYNSLVLLSLSFEDQKKTLPDFIGDSIQDEVLSEFDNGFRVIPQLMENMELSYFVVMKILDCYNLVQLNLSDFDLDFRDFSNHRRWQQVREMAKDILNEMKRMKEE